MRVLLIFLSVFCVSTIVAQPLPNLTCSTAVSGCNDDTLFYQCCAIPTCSPTTAYVDAWYEFCLQDPMNAVQSIEFWARFGFQGYTLYGPLATTATCADAIPLNIYSSSTTTTGSPLVFAGLPAGKYYIHLIVQECFGWVFERNLGFTSECLACEITPCYTIAMVSGTVCAGAPINIGVGSCKAGSAAVEVNFGDGTTVTGSVDFSNPYNATYSYTTPGTYTITVTLTGGGAVIQTETSTITVIDCDIPCENCIGSFAPSPGRYLLSAWVKEKNPSLSKTSYTFPQITLGFPSFATAGPYSASGMIIDGWQRIEQEFVVPSGATQMDINLICTTGDCYFDDIRIFPFDGSMKSYVFDPTNLRLVAELDERNYATMYEYDEEGKLIRIKKETERGIMTIQESKTNVVKK